jgi:hypothetical protein
VAKTLEQPNKSDPKSDWVAFAVSEGTAKDEAEGMTKDELVERFGGDAETAGTNSPTTEDQIEAANEAGAKLDEEPENEGQALMRAGATELPPSLRATAVHRAEVPRRT